MPRSTSRLATITLCLALLGTAIAALFVFGATLGLWEPLTGFRYSRRANDFIGYAVCALSFACLIYVVIRKDGFGIIKSIIAIACGFAILTPMIMGKINPSPRLPPIHDISTDTVNPPSFLVLDDTRPGAINSLTYGGAEIAAHQAAAFPDIAPIQTTMSPSDAFDQALVTAKNLGWEIIAQDGENLRLEASDKTPFYAFVDDIVVVVSPDGTGSRIDLRSVSRVGRGDRGVNAARVQHFITTFDG